MNPFKSIVHKNGFTLHWKNRFGPLAPVAMAASIMFKGWSEYQAGEAANDAAEYNAKVKEREAKAVEQKSLYESRRQAEAGARKISSMQAGIGASGAVSSVGAPVDVLGEQAVQNELDNLMLGYNYQTEAQQLRNEAEQIKYAGKTARYASRLKAGSTLLTGFADMGASGMFGGTTKSKGMTAEGKATVARY